MRPQDRFAPSAAPKRASLQPWLDARASPRAAAASTTKARRKSARRTLGTPGSPQRDSRNTAWYFAQNGQRSPGSSSSAATDHPDLARVLRYRTTWLATSRRLLPGLPPYASLSGAAERGDGLRETDARQIETDLARSRVRGLRVAPADVPTHTAALRRLLRAWCVLRPDVGYSQAMNFGAAVMLAVAGHDEAVAFSLFVALVHRLPPDFYAEAPPLRGFQIEVEALLHLLEARHPALLDVADGAVREALPLIACKWYLNLFVDTLPLASLLAVWNLLLDPPEAHRDAEAALSPPGGSSFTSEGSSSSSMAVTPRPAAAAAHSALFDQPTDILLKASLALIGAHEPSILAALTAGGATDASTAYAAMMQVGANVSPSTMLRITASVELSPTTVASLRLAASHTLEEADAAEAAARPRLSWTPATPARAKQLQQLLRLDELTRLRDVLAASAAKTGAEGVTRERFLEVLKAETPSITDIGLRIYDVLQQHGDDIMPRVSWREIAAALATALRGSLTERLQLVFELFDRGSGEIDVPQLMSMASVLFKLRLLDPASADRPLSKSRTARGGHRARGGGQAQPPRTPHPATPQPAAPGMLDRPSGSAARPVMDTRSSIGTITTIHSNEDEESEDEYIYADGATFNSTLNSTTLNSTLDGDGRFSAASAGVPLRCTAPVTPGPPSLLGLPDSSARGATTGKGGRGGRRGSLEVPGAAASLPRLRRVATVCGGDRFELVQQQANEFLQLLLVMDVDHSGKLSYDEWSRGVLSQPEVLHCFTISIPAASPLRPQRLVSGTRADAALLSRDSVSLATQLWWKSVMSSFFCGAQCG